MIHPTAIIGRHVEIGDWSVIGKYVEIKGDVRIGRKAWIGDNAKVGGGRFELGSLVTGDFLHMGEYSFINIADKVEIGHEVGLGMRTSLYTHGGYLSTWNGFPHNWGPIYLGDNVWLPKATVLPRVNIGSRVVVAAESLVNKDLPPCCLAGGIPARIIKENAYPLDLELSLEQKYGILGHIIMLMHKHYGYGDGTEVIDDGNCLRVGETLFFPSTRSINGPANKATEIAKNLLRRSGIRFRYYNKDGEYAQWD